jgi:RNA methyltransferase, TrmH family
LGVAPPLLPEQKGTNVTEPLKPLKRYKDLTGSAERRESGCFLVEGERAIRQISLAHPKAVVELLSTETPPGNMVDYPVRLLTDKQFRSASHSTTPQGLLAVVELPADVYSYSLPDEAGSRVLLLEDVQDPGNVGTLVRTASAFGYDGIVLSPGCADPFSPKCVQAAAGSVLSLWLRRTDRYLDMAAALAERGYELVAAALNGTDEPSLLRSERLVLALGNEGSGISDGLRSLAGSLFRLPVIPEKAESLNVAVCGGICMYLSTR